MNLRRLCVRSGCAQDAVATLTYDYGQSTAVLGPLAAQAHPSAYDLCSTHAERLSVPRGWQVIRLELDMQPAMPSVEDLEAIADAVREASHSQDPRRRIHPSGLPTSTPGESPGAVRRGHLRIIPGFGADNE